MKIGIVGYGEIGRAIKQLYSKRPPNFLFKWTDASVCIKDLCNIYDDVIKDCDYLHVCIPYSDDFVDQICEYIEKETPKNVLIHSTVQVGTTRKIMEKSGLFNICHAPVRGVHPNLYEGLTTFPMYIGFDGKLDWQDMCPSRQNFIPKITFLLQSVGVNTKVVGSFETSELAKIASTSYYGMCIAFHAEINSLCDEMGLDFEDVMTGWNEGYNKGYKKLGMNNVVRPVLNPPEGSIGGHCIIPNAKLLKDFYYRTMQTKELPDFILKYK